MSPTSTPDWSTQTSIRPSTRAARSAGSWAACRWQRRRPRGAASRRSTVSPGRRAEMMRGPERLRALRVSRSRGAPGALARTALLHLVRLDVQDDGDVVADHHAAVVERLVPLDAEVLPVDHGGGGEAGLRAPGLALDAHGRRAQELGVEHHRLRHAAHRQVAGDLELALTGLL